MLNSNELNDFPTNNLHDLNSQTQRNADFAQMRILLDFHSDQDTLTFLDNRRRFLLTLSNLILQHPNGPHAVIVIDVVGFRRINEALGLRAGDRLLREFAGLLKRTVAFPLSLARLSADEFGILLTDVDRSGVEHILDDLMRVISLPVNMPGSPVTITIHCGVALFPGVSGANAEDLLESACVAERKSRQSARNTYSFHTPHMRRARAESLDLIEQLFAAFEKDEFVLHYQPYVDTGMEIHGMEALVRWASPSGIIGPAQFIPLLEESGLIERLGFWVIRTVCSQIQQWEAEGLAVPPIAVNLSARNFRNPALVNQIQDALKTFSIDPSKLNLEITESTFIEDVPLTGTVLKSLKDLGLSISVDDFGTGFSSLYYLKIFPVDYLKIDRAFVADLAIDSAQQSIVRAVIDLSVALNLKTIAEGVETRQQFQILRELRCDYFQGFAFCRPIPGHQIQRAFKKQTSGGPHASCPG